MTHLELENLVSEYLEGGLDDTGRAQVEEHLRGCVPCQELLADVREAIQTCRSAAQLAPPPWLLPMIRRATFGEARTAFPEEWRALLHAILQPRFAYAVAMAIFSVSLIANIAGFNLRNLNARNLNPSTWFYRANRAGHLLCARAERFYDDLRIVYEIESRFRDAQTQEADQEKQTSKLSPLPYPPATAHNPDNMQTEFTLAGSNAQLEQGAQTHEMR
jgi:Putative zinc-finger